MKIRKIIISVSIVSIFFQSCEKIFIGKEEDNNAVKNFDLVWKNFDERYGMFESKNIDWQKQYDTYRPMLNENSSEAELYNVLTAMLKIFNDNHVELNTTNKNLPTFRSGILGNPPFTFQEDFRLDVIKQNYVPNLIEESPDISYGKIKNLNIGYISISQAYDSYPKAKKIIDKIINDLLDTKGIIIDIRSHKGGMDYLGQYIAGKFATSKKLFMTSRKKNGPAHDQFAKTVNWYVEPTGNMQYKKPVIVLTSRFTTSAGETFTLAMKQNENVKQVGDTTSGAFSDNMTTEMYNGWTYSIATGDYRAANGLSYESIGLAPDYFVVSKKLELNLGQDIALDKAIQLLN
jgi:carboxyl-terminal processing protease